MTKVATSEVAVEIDDRFPDIRVLGTSIGARCLPQTLVSPAMSIWTAAAQDKKSPSDQLSNMIDSQVIERRPVEYAGMRGELVKQEDRLVDAEDGINVAWYRMRVLLASPDVDDRYHATATCSADDLGEVEAAFHRMLASIEVWAVGDAATEVLESETDFWNGLADIELIISSERTQIMWTFICVEPSRRILIRCNRRGLQEEVLR